MTRRLAGLAHGWEGAAWVTLHQVRAGQSPWDDGLARELAARLHEVALAPEPLQPGQLLGLGGAATVAALAASLDAAFSPLATRVIARWCGTDCELDDVLAGHPGALLAIAEIADYKVAVPDAFVDRCHGRTLAALARMLDANRHLLGFAHGLAGLLAAAEVGAARLGRRHDPELIERAFDRLAATRMIAPSIGTVWPPLSDGPASTVTGAWCHGVAGIALALSICHRVTADAAYRELLDEVAPSLDRIACSGPTFCCGRSGQAQAMIELYRDTGDPSWIERARATAATPVAMTLSTEFPEGFSQGALGLAFAEQRLATPLALPLPATGNARATPVQQVRASGREET